MDRFAGAELVVLGDSHSLFFSGSPEKQHDQALPDLYAPTIRTYHTAASTAWHLHADYGTTTSRTLALAAVDEIRAGGFSGWIMCSFGSIDIHRHVAQKAISSGYDQAVRNTVVRYLAFLDHLRTIYPKIAVWGPVATVPDSMVDVVEHTFGGATSFGMECDRNFSALMFTEYLAQGLAARDIPLLSILPLLLKPDGTTNARYMLDGIHINQLLMPHVLELVERRLGVVVARGAYHASHTCIEIDRYENSEITALDAEQWIGMPLLHETYIDRIEVTLPCDAYVGNVFLSTARNPNEEEALCLSQNLHLRAGRMQQFLVGRWGRLAALRFSQPAYVPALMVIKGPVGYFSTSAVPPQERLRAMERFVHELARNTAGAESVGDVVVPTMRYESEPQGLAIP